MFNLVGKIALALILIWTLRPPLFWLIGLEITCPELILKYRSIWLFLLPISYLLTLGLVKNISFNKKLLLSEILPRVICAGVSVFFVFLSLFPNMCGWHERETVLISKHSNSRIVVMDFGCGATDSSPPSIQYRKITRLGKHLRFNRSCDINSLNKENWNSK